MSLSLYKKKRHFNETAEPEGKEKSSKGTLRFVIQKHDASHLHYDLRLEMEGVLKSWAVPKGPSLNPADKRLAMMVEDHPYDYKDFEGIIPEGNYGGGTVIVWDEGFYEPLEKGLKRKEQEKLLLNQLHTGNLKFEMHGKKLKGEFALFKLKKEGDEKSWLLIKHKDEHASENSVIEKNKSVKSGKTLAQVAKENGVEVKHPEETSSKKTTTKPVQLLNKTEATKQKKVAAKPLKTVSSKAGKKSLDVKELLGTCFSLARKVATPHKVAPMFASLADNPFDNADWIFEVKWDGYRSLAFCNGENVELTSRNFNSFTERYYPVTKALKQLNYSAIFDGEIAAVTENGMADFQLLQNWQNTETELQFFIFDLLWIDGYDVTDLPLIERKRILRSVLPSQHDIIKYSDHIEKNGVDFFKLAQDRGLEGIMAKKTDSVYDAGGRSKDWLKIKTTLRQEAIIVGYTKPRNTRQYFGAILIGAYRNGKLQYIGHTGGGFNAKSLGDVYQQLQKNIIDECPLENCPKGNMPVTWVEPKLICEIKFSEWTKEGVMRHPIFMGLRTDKKITDVIIEKSLHMSEAEDNKKTTKTASKKQPSPTKLKSKSPLKKNIAAAKASTKKSVSKSTGELDLSLEKNQEAKLNGQTLQLTNLDKIYWKKEKFSKGEMINYYIKIAPYMLPYMIDRPQSLNRHPNGIDAPNFYQKDMRGKVPDWMETFDEFSESTGETVQYLVCANEATLVYMANLGCIEMHPWHSRKNAHLKPDWCLIDLDPDDPNPFEQVIETAHIVKKVLDSIGAESYVKTSGSSGIHIYIPLGAKYDYDQSKQLAQLVVTMVHDELPDTTSLERSPAKRKGKIYLDYLQNRETQTAAAPYSLRPKPGVPVSTPLDWSEIKKGLTQTTYTAKNIFDRLQTEGDLFKPVLGKGIDLQKVLKKVESLMK